MHIQPMILVRLAAVWLLAFGLVAVLNTSQSSDVLAVPAANGNDNDDGDDDEEQREIEGQVTDVRADMDELDVATLDGVVLVKLSRDQILRSGVQPGDHVSIDGDKEHTYLFHGTDIEIRQRCCPPPGNDND